MAIYLFAESESSINNKNHFEENKLFNKLKKNVNFLKHEHGRTEKKY